MCSDTKTKVQNVFFNLDLIKTAFKGSDVILGSDVYLKWIECKLTLTFKSAKLINYDLLTKEFENVTDQGNPDVIKNKEIVYFLVNEFEFYVDMYVERFYE